MNKTKKILVAIGSRANYSSLKSAMMAISEHPELELEVVAYSSALLDRFGLVAKQIRQDGLPVTYEAHSHVEGELPATMSQSAGLALMQLSQVISSSSPDYVLIVGDRYEVLPVAMSASYMNVRVAHTMGGELTGTIDESIRHAISKLSHLHFPATIGSAERLKRMGENPDFIHVVGCPRLDLAIRCEALEEEDLASSVSEGVGAEVDISKPFVLVSQHPVTTEYDQARFQIEQTLQAVADTSLPAIVLWPNSDAGGAAMSAVIRGRRERNPETPLRFVKNLPAEVYMSLMARTLCLVGNSSSGLREGAFLGTPVVNVGSRQNRREVGDNVIHANHAYADIRLGIEESVRRGRYARSLIYGSGDAGRRIANILAEGDLPPLQKEFFEI